jgi:hypothetical protein
VKGKLASFASGGKPNKAALLPRRNAALPYLEDTP